MTAPVHDFTLDALSWHPYVTPVELSQASEAQRAALQVTPSNTRVSDYVLVLAHDAEMLAARTPLFNDIMYAPGGLSRAERELGSLAASLVNRCVYCAQVHASRFVQLAKRPEVVEALFRDGHAAELPPRDRAIVDFAVKLSRAPDAIGSGDRRALHEAGLGDAEILDLIHAVSIFGWANRLMHTLGEPHAAA